MCVTSFDDLPYEIQTIIGQSLSKRDLAICTCLTSVDFKGFQGDDAVIADFLHRSLAGLRRFTLYWRNNDYHWIRFGEESVEVLLQHVSTLEVFHLDGESIITSKDVQRILCSAPNLKELYLLSDDKYREEDDRNGCLYVQDMVGSDWVCTSLEVFGCQIKGIPRPDITRLVFDTPASMSDLIPHGTHQEYIDLHRQAYSQLARLTKLRKLVLSVPIRENHDSDWDGELEFYRAYDCPAMSLDSGLDLLKELKELRVVLMEEMGAGIFSETAEKGWVAEHWPLLATLDTTQDPGERHDGDFDECYEYSAADYYDVNDHYRDNDGDEYWSDDD